MTETDTTQLKLNWKPYLTILLIWLIGIIIENLTIFVMTTFDIEGNQVLSSTIAFELTVLILMIVFFGKSLLKREEGSESILVSKVWSIKIYFQFYGLILLATLAVQLILSSLFEGETTNIIETSLENKTDLILFLIVAVLLAPIIEELLMRRLLIPILESMKFEKVTAIIISATVFSVAHWLQDIVAGSPDFFGSHMVGTFIIGMIFAYVYSRTRNISHTILLHSVNNLLGSIPIALRYFYPYTNEELNQFAEGQLDQLSEELLKNISINVISQVSVIILAAISILYAIIKYARNSNTQNNMMKAYFRSFIGLLYKNPGFKVIYLSFLIAVIIPYLFQIILGVYSLPVNTGTNLVGMIVLILAILGIPLVAKSDK